MKRLILLTAALAAAGCYTVPVEGDQDRVSSFDVKINGVYLIGSDFPAPVVQSCTDAHPGGVPAEIKGTLECPYALLKSEADFDVTFSALDGYGQPLPTFNGPVSFRVVPGDLATEYVFRWAQMVNGQGQARVRANHVFGAARIWVEDRPPQFIYDVDENNREGVLRTAGLPQEPAVRTNATGLSQIVYFEEPTLAKLQEPEVFDNRDRASSFRGTFVTIGRPPAAGEQFKHNCPTDPERHGKPVLMVVTGIDASGFFVTDVNSCRIPERIDTEDRAVAVPEPDGFFPGTFGSIYVYNYNHPDGLNVGDALWAMSGSIQEFTSTTQLVFASWNIAESVRLLPQSQWSKYLDLAPIHEFTGRTCGYSTTPHYFDNLCAYSTRSLKVESLESTLVRARNVKLPRVFPVCDRTGEGEVEFFCDSGTGWTVCASTKSVEESQCHIDCQTTSGVYARALCSEGTSFNNFGQISVEMAGPGPAEAGLDASIPARTGQNVAVTTTSARTSSPYGTNTQLRVWCDGPVHYALGGSTVTASTSDTPLAGSTLLERYLDAGQSYVAFVSADGQPHQCTVVANPHTKLLTILKDVAPELNDLLDCNPDDTSEANATCRNLHGARYDITGHLRQVQPARPRWMVIPRDLDDLCCHPGPGLSCPAPIQPCQ